MNDRFDISTIATPEEIVNLRGVLKKKILKKLLESLMRFRLTKRRVQNKITRCDSCYASYRK